MSEYQNNLMRNQCMEQCAIYSFLPVGPTYDGLSGPTFPFLAILGSSAWKGNYQGVLQGEPVLGIRSCGSLWVDGFALSAGKVASHILCNYALRCGVGGPSGSCRWPRSL